MATFEERIETPRGYIQICQYRKDEPVYDVFGVVPPDDLKEAILESRLMSMEEKQANTQVVHWADRSLGLVLRGQRLITMYGQIVQLDPEGEKFDPDLLAESFEKFPVLRATARALSHKYGVSVRSPDRLDRLVPPNYYVFLCAPSLPSQIDLVPRSHSKVSPYLTSRPYRSNAYRDFVLLKNKTMPSYVKRKYTQVPDVFFSIRPEAVVSSVIAGVVSPS